MVAKKLDVDIKEIDREWKAEYDSIFHTLKHVACQDIPNVRGGIVFTNSNCSLHIDQTCPVETGEIYDWNRKIGPSNDKNPDQTSELTRIRYAEAIIKYSQKLEGDNTASAVQLAENIYAQKRNELEKFLENFKGISVKEPVFL